MRALFIAASAAGLFAGASASAQPAPNVQSPEVLAKVYACVPIADETARLACFDAAVGQLKTAETTGQFTAVDAAGVRQIEREAFGFSLPSLPRLAMPRLGGGGGGDAAPQQTSEVVMRIARVGSFDGRPAFVMDNGQTWVLVDRDSNRLARAGASVKVKRAAVGSYLMSVDAGGAALRVRRAE